MHKRAITGNIRKYGTKYKNLNTKYFDKYKIYAQTFSFYHQKRHFIFSFNKKSNKKYHYFTNIM